MGHSYVACHVHYVFSTRGRANLLATNVRERLWPFAAGVIRKHKWKALAIGGTADHAHALVGLPSSIAVAHAVQVIKSTSSKWMHETFPTHRGFAWQEGYGAFSIGIGGIAETVAYIENQEAHHRTRSFQEEFVAFLRRHHVEYDERHVWG